MIDNLDVLISKEIRRAVSSVLESKMSSDDNEEKRRQERMASSVKARGVVADSDKSAETQDEAEDEEEGQEEKKSSKKEKDEEEKREDRTGGKGTPDSPKLKSPKSEVLKTPTIGSVIDKINALRGGRSLNDPKVKESFAQYFEGLSTGERQTLLAFLTGVAQILAGTKMGGDAMEPSDIGVLAKEKKPSSASTSKQTGTSENPIVVGENTKYDIHRALKAYRTKQ